MLKRSQHKPIILLTTSNISDDGLATFVGDTKIIYSDRAAAVAIIEAGGIPLYMPAVDAVDESLIDHYLSLVSGVLITGADTHTDPAFYNEEITALDGRIDSERDRVDIMLIKKTHAAKLPLFGICKGMQLINVALGGTLYQNINTQHVDPKKFNHSIKNKRTSVTHHTTLPEKSFLRAITNEISFGVNGGHEQGVKKLSAQLQPSAISEDGIVEVFQSKESDQYIVGTQFHVELMQDNPNFAAILSQFIGACRETAKKR